MEDEKVKDLSIIGGFLESKEKSYIFNTSMKVIQRPNIPANVQIQVPPGTDIPLVDGFSRTYEFSIINMNWKSNSEGV
jgi:hypothetical protein